MRMMAGFLNVSRVHKGGDKIMVIIIWLYSIPKHQSFEKTDRQTDILIGQPEVMMTQLSDYHMLINNINSAFVNKKWTFVHQFVRTKVVRAAFCGALTMMMMNWWLWWWWRRRPWGLLLSFTSDFLNILFNVFGDYDYNYDLGKNECHYYRYF